MSLDASWRPAAAPLDIRLLRQPARSPGGKLGDDPDVDFVLGLDAGRRLLCRACGEPVTAEEHRVSIRGRHVHRRTNPAGFDFEFGCFREASGTVAYGEPTAEHTWFAGHTWRFALCRGCGAHLGWLFEASGSAFHGLILSELEEERPETGEDHGAEPPG